MCTSNIVCKNAVSHYSTLFFKLWHKLWFIFHDRSLLRWPPLAVSSCHLVHSRVFNPCFFARTTLYVHSRDFSRPALGCHCVRRGILQSLPVSCHFRGCKVPLFRTVSGAISSELPLPLPFTLVVTGFVSLHCSQAVAMPERFLQSNFVWSEASPRCGHVHLTFARRNLSGQVPGRFLQINL